jgi:hypothetical protein
VTDLKPLEAAVEETSERKGPPPCKRLWELVTPPADDPDELLQRRFLCRSGGLLLVGPTGIGKSSLSLQFMLLWAMGSDAFGIRPPRRLKSLLVQAENDDGDLAEVRDGVIRGLGLNAEEARQAMENIIVVREDARTGVGFIVETVEPLLIQHQPDLLWIDPALAYLGGEASSQKDVGSFLRNLLNPLLVRYRCGCVVVHHTNKPATGREKTEWNGGDFAYLGSGSIEWANWARAVIAVRSVGSHSVFELRAAKRGGRLGWKEADGMTPTFAKMIAHAREPGVICWQDALPEEIPTEGKAKPAATKEALLAHVPAGKPILKDLLRVQANGAGIALNKINPLIAVLVAEGTLHEWLERRAGTNAKVSYARFPQPERGLVK